MLTYAGPAWGTLISKHHSWAELEAVQNIVPSEPSLEHRGTLETTPRSPTMKTIQESTVATSQRKHRQDVELSQSTADWKRTRPTP